MFKKEAPVYSAALIIYLSVITFLRWQLEWTIVFFWLGGFLGLVLYNVDHLIYLLWQNPVEPTAIKFKELINKKRFKESLNLLFETCQERKRLVAHSVIFQAVLVCLTFFALSSSNSLFGKGMVMGMFLYSLTNQGLKLLKGEDLKDWFWQVSFKLDQRGESLYFLVLVLIFFFLSQMLV